MLFGLLKMRRLGPIHQKQRCGGRMTQATVFPHACVRMQLRSPKPQSSQTHHTLPAFMRKHVRKCWRAGNQSVHCANARGSLVLIGTAKQESSFQTSLEMCELLAAPCQLLVEGKCQSQCLSVCGQALITYKLAAYIT